MSKKKKQEEKAAHQPRGYEDTFSMDEAELEDLATQIVADLASTEMEKSEELDERIKDNNSYYGIKKPSDWPFKGAAKISSKVHQTMVDTTVGNLVSSATAPEEMITAVTQKSQSIENAKYISDFHNALASREYILPEVLDRGWHKAFIESYVVLKPIYQWEVTETVTTITRWIPGEYDPSTIKYDSLTDTVSGENGEVIPSTDVEPTPEEQQQHNLHECEIEVTTEHAKEGIKILTIGMEHIFVPKSSPGETPFEKYQRAPFVINDEYKTIQEMSILQEQKKIKNFEVVRGTVQANTLTQTLQEIKDDQAGMFVVDQDQRYLIRNVWWYGKREYKGKLRELIVYMNLDTKTVLKVKINEFGTRPFFPQVPLPIDGTTGGESLPKRLRSLVTELELILNTVINMGLIKAYPPKFFDPLSGFDPKTVGNFGPNSYIPVRDPSRNVFMPPQPEDPRILMEMVKFLMDLIERSAANSDAVQGQTSATANTTAFEVQQALVRAGVRFDIIYRRLKAQLEPMFQYIHLLCLRFMPLSKEVELMGEQAVVKGKDGSEMSRLHAIYRLEGAHGLTLKGNSMTHEQMEMQKAQELLKVAATPPYSAYLSFKPESPYYLLFNLIKHYNPVMMDKILAKPEEVEQVLRDRAKSQQEQEQQAVDEGKQQGSQQAQMQAQMAQLEMQVKQAQAQMDIAKKEQDAKLEAEKHMQELHQKEQDHEQKMRQLQELHELKLETMRTESNAKAKATANSKPSPKS